MCSIAFLTFRKRKSGTTVYSTLRDQEVLIHFEFILDQLYNISYSVQHHMQYCTIASGAEVGASFARLNSRLCPVYYSPYDMCRQLIGKLAKMASAGSAIWDNRKTICDTALFRQTLQSIRTWIQLPTPPDLCVEDAASFSDNDRYCKLLNVTPVQMIYSPFRRRDIHIRNHARIPFPLACQRTVFLHHEGNAALTASIEK